jgi:hypothetical protein
MSKIRRDDVCATKREGEWPRADQLESQYYLDLHRRTLDVRCFPSMANKGICKASTKLYHRADAPDMTVACCEKNFELFGESSCAGALGIACPWQIRPLFFETKSMYRILAVVGWSNGLSTFSCRCCARTCDRSCGRAQYGRGRPARVRNTCAVRE